MKLVQSKIFLFFAITSVMSVIVESLKKPIPSSMSRTKNQVKQQVVDTIRENKRGMMEFQPVSSLSRGGAKAVSEADDNGWNDLIAPTIYSSFTGILIYIIYQLRDAVTTRTAGSTALAFVTGALIWDNMIISLGSFFFRDADTNPTKYKILKFLSFPRFTLHAVAVPFQFITIAEMGKFAGVGFLQNNFVQIAVIVFAFVLAVYDRKKFVESPGIELDTYEGSPVDALERDLVKFTYVVLEFAYLYPVIGLVLFNLVVGIMAMKAGKSPDVAKWLIFSAVTALIGNGLPGPIMTFTGNLGEACMQYGLLNAERVMSS